MPVQQVDSTTGAVLDHAMTEPSGGRSVSVRNSHTLSVRPGRMRSNRTAASLMNFALISKVFSGLMSIFLSPRLNVTFAELVLQHIQSP